MPGVYVHLRCVCTSCVCVYSYVHVNMPMSMSMDMDMYIDICVATWTRSCGRVTGVYVRTMCQDYVSGADVGSSIRHVQESVA